MRKSLIFIFSLITIHFSLIAQKIEVPTKMKFAGMQITLTEDARDEVQKKVNGLTRSQRFYEDYVERCNIFFPIIEDVFEDEKLPDDFKYLALQESALIADAVSRSNAVGYWQFKDGTAKELGLRVDKNIDERKNIASASRAAAKYLKKNNYFMKNWVYALLSYNLGLTGANNASDRSKIGADKMTLDGKTHIYIIHFLAHKVAFEDAVSKSNSMTKLMEYAGAEGKTLDEIAKESSIVRGDLNKYNRWFTDNKVPRGYAFFLPVPMKREKELVAKLNLSKSNPLITGGKKPVNTTGKKDPIIAKTSAYPKIQNTKQSKLGGETITYATINGKPGFVTADKPVSLLALTTALDISKKKFIKYNDLRSTDEIQSNSIYYLKKKDRKAGEDYHVAQYGETMHDISQMYGVRKKNVRKRNRMREGEEPQAGRVMWLRKNRSRKTPIEIKTVIPPKKDDTKEISKEDEKVAVNLDNILSIVGGDKKEEGTDPNTVITGEKFHVVKAGQNLSEIARERQTTVVDLNSWNGLNGDYALRIGQILIVKDPEKIEAENKGGVGSKSEDLDAIINDVTKIDTKGDVTDETLNDFVDGKTTIKTGGTKDTPKVIVDKSGLKRHNVRQGDNLYAIARLYDISHRDLMAWNNLDPLDALQIGQFLVVENPAGKVGTTTMTKFAEIKKHKIQRGETVYGIARDKNVSVNNLAKWNSLDENTVLSLGQELFLEDPIAYNRKVLNSSSNGSLITNAPKPIYHKVAPNDNLQAIAYRYGVSLNEILNKNNLTINSGLVEGQTLLIRDGLEGTGASTYKPSNVVSKDIPTFNSTPQTKYHIVRKGDNLYQMSRDYGVSVAQIRAWNSLSSDALSIDQQVIVGYTTPTGGKTTNGGGTNPTTIDSGKSISTYIPDYSTGDKSTSEKYHSVKKGDTLYSISKAYGLTVNQLKILNSGLSTSLSLNQKVRVK
jgi:membrane-bound lytic murein transglycosylase D